MFLFVALSLLLGTSVIDGNTTILGSSGVNLNLPIGLALYGDAENESLVVVDQATNQVIRIENVNSPNKNVSLLIRNWYPNQSMYGPYAVLLDITSTIDVYVTDSGFNRVVMFSSMQTVNPPPRVVAGVTGVIGTTLDKFNRLTGITKDSQNRLYILDQQNHRVTRWAPNATAGVLIAGTGTGQGGPMGLYWPAGIYLDEIHSFLYVADQVNHRIQRFRLNGTPPYNGTTVAGGFGPGSGSHQLHGPTDVWVSKQTGAIYIADFGNSRIQRWNQNASAGVTLAGSPTGAPGSSNGLLYYPFALIINSEETHMYVSDAGNHRVQRFSLI
jgi:hypothetical protein